MVSIYANKKRHHRKKGPWRLSSCPWTLGTLPYLTRLLDLVCRAARISYSCHVVLKSVYVEWDFPGVSPELYMLQALSNVVFLAHKDYSAPVIREQRWDAKVSKKIFFLKVTDLLCFISQHFWSTKSFNAFISLVFLSSFNILCCTEYIQEPSCVPFIQNSASLSRELLGAKWSENVQALHWKSSSSSIRSTIQQTFPKYIPCPRQCTRC